MKIHFMGDKGSGVAGVMSLSKQMGYEVSGCDLAGSGHDESHIEGVDLVVASPAVFYQSSLEPEFISAKEKGILITWQEFVGKHLMVGKKVIGVAGTHGKSTTTAMVGSLLIDAGLDPTVVLGASVPEWGGSSRYGKGEYFVIESDEFYDNFLNYHPDIILLTNIEFDHPDYFKNDAHVFDSFKKFVGNLVGSKTLFVNPSEVGIEKLLRDIDTAKVNMVKVDKDDSTKLSVPGNHNILNASLVFTLAKHLGISELQAKKSLESFSGIGRRLELLGEKDGVKVYDDYAHHPTEIKATIEALKGKYPDSKIWAVVEPHGFDRTHALLDSYKGVFDSAERAVVGPIFKARDSDTFGISPQSVATVSEHNRSIGVDSVEEVVSLVKSEVKSGDIILVMGAGKSSEWAREIFK